MTEALCFKCGNIKWGAIRPCPDCGGEASGNFNLDIAFSDHRMSRTTLEKFGNFIKLLKTHSADDEVCFGAFVRFVSEKYPSILTARIPEEIAAQVDSLLAKVEYPEIEIEMGIAAQIEKERAEKRARKIEAKRTKGGLIHRLLGKPTKRDN